MITKPLIREINKDIQEALQAVALKYKVKISLDGSSFGKLDFVTKVKVELPEAEQVNAEEVKRYAVMLGLPEDIVTKKLMIQGKEYEVLRLDIGKPKNPIIIGREMKTYKISVETLKKAMGIA